MSLSTAVDYPTAVVTVHVLGSDWRLVSLTTYSSLSGPHFHPVIYLTGYDSMTYMSTVLLPEFTWKHLVIIQLSFEGAAIGEPFRLDLAALYGPLLRSNPPSVPVSSAIVSSMGPPTGDIFRTPTGNILTNLEIRARRRASATKTSTTKASDTADVSAPVTSGASTVGGGS